MNYVKAPPLDIRLASIRLRGTSSEMRAPSCPAYEPVETCQVATWFTGAVRISLPSGINGVADTSFHRFSGPRSTQRWERRRALARRLISILPFGSVYIRPAFVSTKRVVRTAISRLRSPLQRDVRVPSSAPRTAAPDGDSQIHDCVRGVMPASGSTHCVPGVRRLRRRGRAELRRPPMVAGGWTGAIRGDGVPPYSAKARPISRQVHRVRA